MSDNWSIKKKTGDNSNIIKNEKVSLGAIKQYLKDSVDIKYKTIFINDNKEWKATLVFIEGLVNTQLINESILKPLRQEEIIKNVQNPNELICVIMNSSVYHLAQQKIDLLKEAISNVLNGNIILVFDKEGECISFDAKGFEKRSINEPTNENIVKGSKDSFIEAMKVNTALIRRRIKTTKLRIEEYNIGTITPTAVSVIYLDGMVDKSILENLKDRIKNMNVESLSSLSVFEEKMKDNKYSLFPQTIYTERPDKACSNIIEGRIIVLIDGYPVSYIFTVSLPMLFQASEDYSNNYIVSSFIRIIRYCAMVLTILLPALYVAILTFHQDMIPTSLAESIIKSKQNVPFTAFTETLLMLFAFEIIIEAGLRMPKSIGQAVSIIGGLIVGEAAISANFLSPAVVVVVAIAGITRIFVAKHRNK